MKVTANTNWLGLYTLYMREVLRFFKVYTQTIIGPIVTSLLFLAVFSLAIGRTDTMVGSVTFLEFLGPGLIMMAIMQNAFANTSSSLVIAKVQGNIVDILMPPFNAHELTLAIALGGATRGIVVGLVVGLAVSFFVPFNVQHVGFVLAHGFLAALMLSLLGCIGGIWADKFDQMAGMTNFIITPLSFLSGTFYSIQRLPETVQIIAQLNPFFYMIDGFRYGFIGTSDANPMVGLGVVFVVDVVLWMACWKMFDSGYKLKS